MNVEVLDRFTDELLFTFYSNQDITKHDFRINGVEHIIWQHYIDMRYHDGDSKRTWYPVLVLRIYKREEIIEVKEDKLAWIKDYCKRTINYLNPRVASNEKERGSMDGQIKISREILDILEYE